MALTQEDRQAGAQASVAARHRRILERAQRAEIVETVVQASERAEIGPELLQHALNIARLSAEAVPALEIDTPLGAKQLAEAAQILHKMARLELGESTANTAVVNVTDAFAKQRELDARLAALKDGQQG